jgi:hypothetical protein
VVVHSEHRVAAAAAVAAAVRGEVADILEKSHKVEKNITAIFFSFY